MNRAAFTAGIAILVPFSILGQTVLTSGTPQNFTVPAVTGLRLLSGSSGFRISVPSGATRLEVRLSIPSSVQFAIGLRHGTDFSTTTFNAEIGGIVGQNPVIVSTTTSPSIRPGEYYIGILIVTNTSPANATVTATITSGPALSAPGSLLFGPVTVGQSADRPLTVRNTSTRAVTVNSVSSNLAVFSLASPPAPIPIPAGEQRDLIIRFRPASAGAITGTLTIASDDPAQSNLAVTVGGTGVAALAPSITAASGVVNGASFAAGIAASSWVTIRGTNLSSTTRIWGDSDFANGRLPVVMDGVSVKINNRDAFVYYISPAQLNVLAPDDVATGDVSVTVTNSLGTSAPAAAAYQRFAPAFFTFDPRNRIYPAAVHPDGVYVGPDALFGTAAVSAPARPGGRVLLYGTGFGPTNPVVDPARPFSGAAPLSSPGDLRILIANVAATVEFAGLVSNGLYQFNIIVPDVPDGDQTIVAEIGGLRTQSTLRLAVRRPPSAPQITSLLPRAAITGQTVELTVSGRDMAGATAVEINPPDGIAVGSFRTSGSTSVNATLTISPAAAPGDRNVSVLHPAGTSNTLAFTIHQGDRPFSISNLRVGPGVNSSLGMDLPFTIDVDDPTGSACRSSIRYLWVIGGPPFGQLIIGSGSSGALTCADGFRGAMQRTISYSQRLITGTDIPFEIYLTSDLGVQSNRLRGTFRVQ